MYIQEALVFEDKSTEDTEDTFILLKNETKTLSADSLTENNAKKPFKTTFKAADKFKVALTIPGKLLTGNYESWSSFHIYYPKREPS